MTTPGDVATAEEVDVMTGADGWWRLASAQGTPIAAGSPA